jgi:dATP pyrophosphohydrolase
VTSASDNRAPFQVLVFPFRRQGDEFVYALFRREDAGYWQGVAGGGDAGESPLEAARRETLEEAGLGVDTEFGALDARASMPVVAVTGEFTWGPSVPVIPEYAFGAGTSSEKLQLSAEHTEYRWFSLDEAYAAV